MKNILFSQGVRRILESYFDKQYLLKFYSQYSIQQTFFHSTLIHSSLIKSPNKSNFNTIYLQSFMSAHSESPILNSNQHPRPSANRYSTGRWTQQEKQLFENIRYTYEKNWKKMATIITTRTSQQIRSHAQKVEKKQKELQQLYQKERNRQDGRPTTRSRIKKIHNSDAEQAKDKLSKEQKNKRSKKQQKISNENKEKPITLFTSIFFEVNNRNLPEYPATRIFRTRTPIPNKNVIAKIVLHLEDK